MAVTTIWLLLVGAAASWEVVCWRHPERWTSLTRLCADAWSHPPGRVLLFFIWAFIGWHVFSRYTLPA